MAYYMNKSVPAKRGDIFYISNSKCYATDPSNAEGRPAIVVSSDKLNEHADVVEVVYLTTKESVSCLLMQRCCARFLQPLCVRPSTRSIRTGWAISSVPVPIRKWRVSMLESSAHSVSPLLWSMVSLLTTLQRSRGIFTSTFTKTFSIR